MPTVKAMLNSDTADRVKGIIVLIGELARRSGVSVRMLRYYESRSLLKPARRETGYRVYGEDDLQRVKLIRLLNGAGLTLDKVLRLLPCVLTDEPTFQSCPELNEFLKAEIAGLDSEIRNLSTTRDALAGFQDATFFRT
jgi:DNA-binding transcriptional MerR regulator